MDLTKIILKTNDEVDIHEGEWVWVIKDLNKEPEKWLVYDYSYDLIVQSGREWIYFSTKQNADEYIYWHRKVFSRKEMKGFFEKRTDKLLKNKI